MAQPEALRYAERDKRFKFGELFDQFYTSEAFLRLGPSTQSLYITDLCRLLTSFEERDISPSLISDEEIYAILNKIPKTTALRKQAAINKFLEWARSKGLFGLREVKPIKLEREPEEIKPLTCLTPKEYQSLIAAAQKNRRHGLRNSALVTLVLKTGANPAEIIDLDIDDIVSVNHKQVAVRFKKKKGERTVTLDNNSSQTVKKQAEVSKNTGVLFPGRGKSGRLTRPGFNYILRQLGKEIGREDLSPRILRQTFIMNFQSDDLIDLKNQLGIKAYHANNLLKRRRITQLAVNYSPQIPAP